MKKRLLIVSALILSSTSLFAQQDMALTHWMYTKMLVNPGSTGIDEGICGTLLYRNQYDKVNGAPNSAVLNVEANLRRFFPGGVGLSVAHDAIGFNRQNNILLNYSFPIDVGNEGILGLGVGLGMVNFGLNPNWVPPTTSADPSLPASSSAINFDGNFGVYFKGFRGYYFGISSTHLTAPDMPTASALGAAAGVNYSVARHYYVMGGYKFQNIGEKGAIELQGMMRTELVKFSGDINVRYIYDNKYYGGVTYRTTDAVAFMVGGTFGPITAGYSYDLSLNKLASVSRGTHELFVKYCYYLPPPPKHPSLHPRWL